MLSPLLATLSSLVLLLRAAAFEDNIFEQHMKKFLNHSVSPCDNFFRHVCPLDFSDKYSVMTQTEQELKNIAKFGALFTKLPPRAKFSRNTAEAARSLYEESVLVKSYIKHTRTGDIYNNVPVTYLYTTPGLIDKHIMEFSSRDQIVLFTLNSFYKGLFFRSAIVFAVESDPEGYNFDGLNSVVRHINATFHQMLKDAKYALTPEEYEKLLDWSTFVQIFLPFEDENLLDVNRYANLIAAISRAYDRILHISGIEPFTEANFAQRVPQFVQVVNATLMPFVETLKLFAPNLYVRTKNALLWNTENVFARFVVVQEALMLPLLQRGVGAAEKYASLGTIVAHEMVHSFVTLEQVGRDAHIDATLQCQAGEYQRACDEWSEGSCESGAKTLFEDAADSEGVQVAFKAFQDSSQYKLTDNAAFFYALAITFCRSTSEIQNTHHSAYSPIPIRINSMVSKISAFAQTFNCTVDAKMISKSECRYFQLSKSTY